MSIKLWSCESLKVAKQLSQILKVEVTATADYVAYEHGIDPYPAVEAIGIGDGYLQTDSWVTYGR